MGQLYADAQNKSNIIGPSTIGGHYLEGSFSMVLQLRRLSFHDVSPTGLLKFWPSRQGTLTPHKAIRTVLSPSSHGSKWGPVVIYNTFNWEVDNAGTFPFPG